MGINLTPSSSPSPPLKPFPPALDDSQLASNTAVTTLLPGHASLQSTNHQQSGQSSGVVTEGPNNSHAKASSARPRLEIEMDPLTPAGHRRRRSSLMNPVGGSSGSGRPSRPRSQPRSQAVGLEDSKIVEEGSTDAKTVRPNDHSDGSLSDEDLHEDEETGLTNKDKRRKDKKKRRNTRLDQRIVRESITAEEKREADQNVVKKSLVNLTLIGLWYLFSLSISIVSRTPGAPLTSTGGIVYTNTRPIT